MSVTVRAKPRQTQRERSDATIEDLLAAARVQFARNGYAGTSLDAVCEAAGVTKGALYHHFKSKQHLFQAVYEREQKRLADLVARAYFAAGASSSWEAVFEGARAFLDAVLEPGVQRISLLDAPGALGWETVREIGMDCVEMMTFGIKRAIESGDIAPRSARTLSHLLYGAVCEAAMEVAQSDDQQAVLELSLAELRRLFDAFALHPVPVPA